MSASHRRFLNLLIHLNSLPSSRMKILRNTINYRIFTQSLRSSSSNVCSGIYSEHNVKTHNMNNKMTTAIQASRITQLYKPTLFSECRQEISRYNEDSKKTIYSSSDEMVLIFWKWILVCAVVVWGI